MISLQSASNHVEVVHVGNFLDNVSTIAAVEVP